MLNVVMVFNEPGIDPLNSQHSVGKTKLGELIDYLLLRKHDKMFMFKERNREKFEDHEFYLEILLNDGRYTTIRRKNNAPTKIDFITYEKRTTNFELFSDFDETLPFDRAKVYLNTLLGFDFSKRNNESYRRLINYSIRTQGDYNPKMNTLFQLSKFLRNKDRYWKPLLFNLLGFDGNLLKEKYVVEEQIKALKDEIKLKEKDIGYKLNDKDSLIGQIQNLEAQRDSLNEKLEAFDFYKKDREIIKNLVGSVEQEISELNTRLYNIEYDIKKLENSLKTGFSFNTNKVEKLFKEVELFFPDSLKKTYNELIEFNKKITSERNKQIDESLSEKKIDLANVTKRLRALNGQRVNYRQVVKDTSLFRKYSQQQSEILLIEKELSRKEALLELLDSLNIKKQKIESLKQKELAPVKEKLEETLDSTISNNFYMNIRKIFSFFVREVLNENALITLKQNNSGNIDFGAEFPNSAKDEGNTYYRILCSAFDLAVLIAYNKESYYRFIYHDDIISGDDEGVQSRFVESIIRICSKYDIQYIFSTISDNLPDEVISTIEPFVVTKLSNKDSEGKLFKFGF